MNAILYSLKTEQDIINTPFSYILNTFMLS
ncbi:Uncharacterised protein [Peptostreptococcus anaerobius]|uniref:Uncharacterized protein n=1 Tax=Peptostreptococcus anaerobius TaxID=1261 RepID=A0A379CEG6_9FIRM|nr:Uncharacterised protein [Streptococcus agalactiae]SUB60504.1 Uncharacterised protein [Peptostreptococcus anaerobius]